MCGPWQHSPCHWSGLSTKWTVLHERPCRHKGQPKNDKRFGRGAEVSRSGFWESRCNFLLRRQCPGDRVLPMPLYMCGEKSLQDCWLQIILTFSIWLPSTQTM